MSLVSKNNHFPPGGWIIAPHETGLFLKAILGAKTVVINGVKYITP